MKDHDMTEYANRNGYDRAMEEFIAGAKKLLQEIDLRSMDDFEWGKAQGVNDCISIAEHLRRKNNGENEENTDTNETDLLQTHLSTDKAQE